MERILIVEDDMELNQALGLLLCENGYEVSRAFSIKDTKHCFEASVGMILLDVNLPDGDGFSFCKWLRERSHVPVIFLTARDLEEDVLMGYECGAEDYVIKPFSMKVLLAGLTIWAGSRKPACRASKIAPVEALGYRPADAAKTPRAKARGKLLWRLAKEQIFTPQLMETMRENDRIQEVHPLWSTQITVPWEPEFSDIWMTVPYEQDLEEYKAHPENFGTFLIGIDDQEFKALNQTLETPADAQRFLDGETCILYRNGLDFTSEDLRGKRVACAEYDNSENTLSFEIAGLTNESYYIGSLVGCPLIIIVSDRVVKAFVPEPLVDKVGILYKEEFDEEAEEEMLSLMDATPYQKDYSYESKIEELAYIEKSQGNKMEIGLGVTLLLALIGILNYINTVIGNIENRRSELAILESIGMTGRQTDQMLVYEGLLLAVGALVITERRDLESPASYSNPSII